MSSKPENTEILCYQCGRQTNHSVQATHSRNGNTEDLYWWESWFIVSCAGCGTLLAVQESFDSESEDTTTVCYPKRHSRSHRARRFSSAPKMIRGLYREMMESYNANLPILCGVGLRAIVEGICADKNVLSGMVADANGASRRRSNLQGKINGLVENGILTQKHATILHKHRFLGNSAVHEMVRPSLPSLAAAIGIIEHTLENLYEIEDQADLI